LSVNVVLTLRGAADMTMPCLASAPLHETYYWPGRRSRVITSSIESGALIRGFRRAGTGSASTAVGGWTKVRR
jgi:hypothetical protein